jgi:hypothetical protein
MQQEMFGNAPAVPTQAPKEDRPRLTRQCRQLLERLQHGAATNRELAAVSLKYTSRISDLRQAGYDVRVVERNHSTGMTLYALFTE